MSEIIQAGIIGMGSAVPDRVLTNADIEKFVDTNDEWIVNMTGIHERRIADEGKSTSDYAALSAIKALERAGLKATDLDLILLATITPDMPFPATASIVQNAIGATGVPAFDLSAGCSGWVYGLSVANAFVSSGIYKNVMVIGADLLSRVTDWTDRSTCILFGDGAGTGIVGPVEKGYGFHGFTLGSDGSSANVLNIRAGGSRLPCTVEEIEKHGNKIHMEGREVFKFAVKIQGEAILEILQQIGMSPDDLDMVVPHQANIRIIDSAIKRLGIPKEKFYVNLQKYGNTSAASIPIAIDEALSGGCIHKGDNIAVVGFGAGLTWGAGVMKWAY